MQDDRPAAVPRRAVPDVSEWPGTSATSAETGQSSPELVTGAVPADLRRVPSRQEVALGAVTAVWGATFWTVQHGLALAAPFTFVALRFAVAAAALAGSSLPVLRRLTRREVVVGALTGLALFGGYGLQTVGLKTIPSSTSAFLTALYVPLVPLLQWLVLRRRPGAGSWAGIALAFVGLFLLTSAGAQHLGGGSGEVATLGGAVAIAAEILLVGHFAGTVDARRVAVLQLATCAVLAALWAPLAGEGLPAPSWELAAIVAALGLASAVIQVTMNWAQRSVSSTRATVIYAGEPVWAGVVGRLAGERLSGTALLGGVLVVIAVLVPALLPARPSRGGEGARTAARAARTQHGTPLGQSRSGQRTARDPADESLRHRR